MAAQSQMPTQQLLLRVCEHPPQQLLLQSPERVKMARAVQHQLIAV
jgi:hypothetical protein